MSDEREQQLIRAARHSLVGQLTRAAAHELNNPLFVVLGLIELVSLRLDPASKERERLDLALGSGDEMKEILRTLLEVARPDPEGEPQVVDLGAVLGDAVAAARRLTLAKDVELVAAPAAGFPVRGYPAELRQLFLTLFANAQEAQPDGGRVQVSAAAENGGVTVTVADEGPGIPPELEAELFEPLAAGLGLAAARTIARRHGGELELASRTGAGTTATLRLPLAG